MKNKIKLYAKVILFAGAMVLIVAIVSSIENHLNRDKGKLFEAHAKFTTCIVTDYKMTGVMTSLARYTYHFSVKDRTITGTFDLNYGSDDFIGHRLLVVYDSTDLDHSCIVLFPRAYKAWNIPFPDSLHWVLPFQ